MLMSVKFFKQLAIAAALMIGWGLLAAQAEDWPRWRGPRGDGSWQAPELPKRWPETGLQQVWKQPIGGGYGGISVVGDRLYVMDRPTEPEQVERVLCLNCTTGEKMWEHIYAADYGKLEYGNGPRATPTVFENRVYTFGTLGHTHCFDADDGTVIWSHDFLGNDDATVPEWGLSGSPVIWKNLVIVHPGANGGCYVALDRKTGAEVWRSSDDPAGYGTPILISHNGNQQLVCWSPRHILGLKPADGTIQWSIPYEVEHNVSIATPIFRDGIVFVTGYWHGAKAIELGDKPDQAKLLWEENRHLRGLMCQPLYRDGYLYSLDKNRGLVCFQFRDCEKMWTDDKHRMTPRGRNPQANLVWLGDTNRVIILNAEGDLILARLTPEGYDEQSRTNIIDRTWAHPAFAGQHVYVRNDNEILCVRLTD